MIRKMKRDFIRAGTVRNWLTVIEDEKPRTYKIKCRCKCGKELMVSVADFLHDKTKSCGCYNRAQKTRHTIEPGQRFEHCVALRPISDTVWMCRCECGNEFTAAKKDLCTGHVTSCGCIQDERHKNIHEDLIDGTKIKMLRIQARNASGHKGVYYVKNTGRWRASITFQNRHIALGTYDDIADAIAARKAAEEKYFLPVIKKYEEEKKDGLE